MCEPTTIAIAMGAGKAISGIQNQNRAHRAQVDAVNRSNAMARQKYLNDIQISAYNDQRKLQVYEAKLASDAMSRQNYYKQREINQSEATRAKATVEQEFQEKLNQAAFESQANLAKSIQAQGTVLAGASAQGQSMMLELQQAERELGFEQAQIDATIFDATKSFGFKNWGIDMDHYAANVNASNNVQTTATMAPTASFMTIRPIKQKAPKKPSILGPILSGVTTTLGAGTALGGEDHWKSMFE